MQDPQPIRWRDLDLDPIHWAREVLRVGPATLEA